MTRLCEIRSTALSVDEVIAAVGSPEAGAVAVFMGAVRNHNAGQAVSELEYSAYESMAAKEMLAILEQIERETPGTELAALHRVGRLVVGDIAVICAAGAAHRAEAFAACELAIERIKARVPIWKREHGPGGAHWVGWQDARTPAR